MLRYIGIDTVYMSTRAVFSTAISIDTVYYNTRFHFLQYRVIRVVHYVLKIQELTVGSWLASSPGDSAVANRMHRESTHVCPPSSTGLTNREVDIKYCLVLYHCVQ